MKIKKIIIVLILAVLLMVLTYTLLSVIDLHMGVLLILITTVFILADIITMVKLFFSFMKHSGNNRANMD